MLAGRGPSMAGLRPRRPTQPPEARVAVDVAGVRPARARTPSAVAEPGAAAKPAAGRPEIAVGPAKSARRSEPLPRERTAAGAEGD